MHSGPMGGDAEIAAMVVRKEIDLAVFLIDDLNPQPHEADIQMLLRQCRVHPFFLESFTNQISGRTRTNNMVVRQELSVMYRPFYHFRLTIVVRYKRDSQLFHTLYLFNY
jgi:methylglyoxal synthase